MNRAAGPGDDFGGTGLLVMAIPMVGMSCVHRRYYTTMDNLIARVESLGGPVHTTYAVRTHLWEPEHGKGRVKELSGSPPGLELPHCSLGGVFQGDSLPAQSIPYLVCQGKLLGLA